MPYKAVALFSGGLDSSLAVCVVREQGVEVFAFHLRGVFTTSDFYGSVHPDIVAAAEELGVPLHDESSSEDMFALVRAPAHGFGKNLNPCIDCRMNALARAEIYRKEIGADFLITGEVLGQRPMSQNRKSLDLIARKCGVDPDLILRPLSAQMLEPTKPEREGWVDRSRLPCIEGRGRGEQLALAKKFGISKYGSPAGGCLLTDKNYCLKLKYLLRLKPDCTVEDARLLRVGRHFADNGSRLVVTGRDHAENLKLCELARAGDVLFQCAEPRGSMCLVRDSASPLAALPAPEELRARFAVPLGLAVHYSRARESGAAPVEALLPGMNLGEGVLVPCVAAVDHALAHPLSLI